MGLQYLEQESLAVSGDTQLTTALFTPGGLRASIQHLSGGEVYYSTKDAAPSNTGANGEHIIKADAIVVIKGNEDMRNAHFIKKSGAADAVLQVRYEKIEGAG